jgi:hypothetical protein
VGSHIIIQSDCIQGIEALHAGSSPSTTVDALFDDIYIQSSMFSSCDFSFYSREANFIVDCLLRETDSLPCVGR